MAGGTGDHQCYIGFEQQATDAGYGSSLQYLEELGRLRAFVDLSYDRVSTDGNHDPSNVLYRQVETRVAGELALLLGVTLEDIIV